MTRSLIRSASALCGVLCGLAGACRASAAEHEVVIVSRSATGGEVRLVPLADARVPEGRDALVVWAAGGRDRWLAVRGPWGPPSGAEPDAASPASPDATRGVRTDPGADPSIVTAALPQLANAALFRDPAQKAAVISPAPGELLIEPRVTLRRAKTSPTDPLASVVVVIARGEEEVARVTFPEGRDRVGWLDHAPGALKNGLPPGEYRLKAGGAATTFRIADDPQRKQVLAQVEPLAELLGGKDSPAFVLAAAEHLLGWREDDEARPFLSDTLGVIESVSEKDRSPHVAALRTAVLARLCNPGKDSPVVGTDAPTGDKAIDDARALIAAGRWGDALARFDKLLAADAPRTRGLARLYRAVVLAEAGLGRADEAARDFVAAGAELATGPPADAFRARLNAGNFFAGQALDRLNNQSLRAASGVPRPVHQALAFWAAARNEYESALRLTDRLTASDRAVVEIDLARLSAILADLIRTLSPAGDARVYRDLEGAAAAEARRWADRAVHSAAGDSPAVRALAEETLAHLDYRAGRWDDARRHAASAREGYERAGSLAGLESTFRLGGLIERAGASKPAGCERALKSFRASYHIGEILRARYAADRAGRSRAGFLARRAYVHGQIVELLLAAGRDTEALTFAECAKSRALLDVLAARGVQAGAGATPPDVGAVLRSWPRGTVALEYFLGEESAWVFVIGAGGRVKAHRLVGLDGKPVTAADLIARAVRFQSDATGQKFKMRAQLGAGGFDHRWQDELHRFYRELIPADVAAALRTADTLLVVPVHALHYLPFAALVTEPDARKRTGAQMAQPRFLIDGGFALGYAPSLAVWHGLRSRPARPLAEVNVVGLVQVPGASTLFGVEEELAHVKAAFGGIRQAVRESEADRAAARRLFARPGLLVIATHGQNVPDDPLSSHLMLHPKGAGDDGLLTATDVYDARVGAEVVVLSACYSGLGDRAPLPGDDLFGLQRAFLAAGAGTVVSGLWDICDVAGPVLMSGFYTRLSKGDSPAAALAQAQRAFVKQARSTAGDPWVHPYFWAVYTATGR